jgi:hypothetical protein
MRANNGRQRPFVDQTNYWYDRDFQSLLENHLVVEAAGTQGAPEFSRDDRVGRVSFMNVSGHQDKFTADAVEIDLDQLVTDY